LAFELFVSTFKHTYKWTGAELFGDCTYVGQTLRLAKSTDESATLDTCSPKQAPLGKDDGPGDQTENQKKKKDDFGDRSGFPYKINDLSADEYSQK
jgi:hypothetical protein